MIYGHLSTKRLEKLYARTNDATLKRELDARNTKAGLRKLVEHQSSGEKLQAC